ncbi:MAG: PAS domain S-box protein [Desulfobacula sp.]|jgi:PAS domain S-box-containing protein|uniref:PAS domain-containing sensor histidine kinase n=2 Tax=Desulfobacula sp. TaxID=2593537 RepID=UPI001D5894DD|nr:PAS domain S-box protein [Desulfobacula sp.]MBT3486133.1 PAS domain S-box protein [Desulfobacula sp.]MBT3805844.1 PAS domain S-box protein [Desulfobacula sp.]MBT4026131.1 PAS domain S-box protein [Desulfobacula sp.]MBT4200226.1 PAS domain S-box protein [Desulfobacula sp.]
MAEKPSYEELARRVQDLESVISDRKKIENELQVEIIEREKAVEELEVAETLLRSLIETIPDLIWLKDKNGVYISCNLKFEEFFGMEEVKIIGKSGDDFIDKKLIASFRQKDMEALANDRPIVYEENVTSAYDGHKELLEIIKTPMYDLEGRLIGVLGIGRDITKRKQTEIALIQNRDQLESILSNIQGITYRCALDKDWTMIYMSNHVDHLTGYPPDDFINNAVRTYGSIIYQDDIEYVDQAINEALKFGKSWEIEYRICHKSKGIRWVYEKGRGILLPDGSVEYLDGFIIDISRRKIIEEHFLQNQKLEAIGTLAGGIAHDFNNILGGILGLSELLQEDLQEIECSSDIRNKIDLIIKGGLRAKDLVTQILAFSSSKQEHLKPVNIVPIVNEILKFLKVSLPPTIEIRTSFCSQSLLMTDPTRIHQVLMNLCTNAGYAMKEKGGFLSISIKDVFLDQEMVEIQEKISPGRFLLLSVEDTGLGMSHELISKIMEPFFTTKPKGKGTGMGLWVVQGIIKSMGGFIEVASRLGQGSKFNVYMPVCNKGNDSVTLHSENQSLIGTENILFVDDENFLTQSAKTSLSKLGLRDLLDGNK